MAEKNSSPNSAPAAEPAKSHFAKAVEEAKAGAQALTKEAQDRAEVYRDKATQARSEWIDEARAKGNQAKGKASELAVEGKASASKAIASLGKIVEENAAVIDDKVGEKYGDYVRVAARSLQDTATKLDSKDIGELGDDAKKFIRTSPGLAIGIAAVGGFMLARLFKGSDD